MSLLLRLFNTSTRHFLQLFQDIGRLFFPGNEVLQGERITPGKEDYQAHSQKQTVPQEGEGTSDIMSISAAATIDFRPSYHCRTHTHSKGDQESAGQTGKA